MNKQINFKNLTDGVLVQRYLDGESTAIEAIIERHRGRVLNYITSMVGSRNTADDIFQETLLKAVSSIEKGKYSDDGRFISWLLRIAHNQVIDHFRHNKRKKEFASEDNTIDVLSRRSGDFDNGAEGRIMEEQTAEQLKRLVDILPAEQREVILMRHYMNLSFKEIADQTGVSINTALGRMRYAIKNLRKSADSIGLELA